MSGSGRVAFPKVREWSGGPLGCSGVVERPSRMSRVVGKALPYCCEALPDTCEWSGGTA